MSEESNRETPCRKCGEAMGTHVATTMLDDLVTTKSPYCGSILPLLDAVERLTRERDEALDGVATMGRGWEAAEAALAAERENSERLAEAVKDFLTRYDKLMPHVVDDRDFAQNHGLQWTYGSWEIELQNLRALAASAEGALGPQGPADEKRP